MLTIEIRTDNAAFSSDDAYAGSAGECARILRRIAERLEAGHTSGKAMDANGNSVGWFELVDESESES